MNAVTYAEEWDDRTTSLRSKLRVGDPVVMLDFVEGGPSWHTSSLHGRPARQTRRV